MHQIYNANPAIPYPHNLSFVLVLTVFFSRMKRTSHWWYYQSLPSTNDQAKTLALSGFLKEGAVVYAENQSAGRGQHQTKWESSQNHSLTCSLVLFPEWLPAQDQFWLNMAVTVGIIETLQERIPLIANALAVKWPNDLLLNERKLGGILIENVLEGHYLQQAIVGIGLNLNQSSVEAVPGGIALSNGTGGWYEPYEMAQTIIPGIMEAYEMVKQGETKTLRERYFAQLYKLNEPHQFKTPEGNLFNGRITGIDPTGRLLIANRDGVEEAYGVKSIRF